LAEEELAVGIEDRQRGDAAVEGNIVFFGDVEIFVHAADVDVEDEEGFVQGGSDFRAVESFVEDVAIEAPVAAEDDEDAAMGRGGGVESFGDLLAGIGIGGIEILPSEGLTEQCGGGMLGRDEEPVVALAGPLLDHGDELLMASSSLFGREGELEKQSVEIGIGVVFLDELGGEVGEALGFPGGPEDEFVLEGDGFLVDAEELGFGRFGVEGGEGGGIAGKDGGAPVLEGGEGGGELGWGGGGEKNEKEWKEEDATHGASGAKNGKDGAYI
jgi:hypothetical protein